MGRWKEGKKDGKTKKKFLDDLNETRGYWKLKKRKHWIALCGKFDLERTVNLSQDRLQNE